MVPLELQGYEMKVGDVVTWSWRLSTGWEETKMQGIIVDSRLCKTDYDKVILFRVFLTDGTLCELREDEAGLENVV